MARTTMRLLSSLLVAGVSATEPTLRDALLCEAHKRIGGWYEGGHKETTMKYRQDGIELRFLNEFLPCGGQDAIVTFANFSVKGVKPIHVYSAIVDIVGQKAWNPAAHEIRKLRDDEEQGVRGVKLLYYATPFQDRKVYEYEAYNLSKGESWLEGEDLWFAASSCNDLQKYDEDADAGGFLAPVLAFSCLSAHHIRWAPDGETVYASFTNTINGVPPFGLQATIISEMTWGKTVDFIKALRVQAKKLKAAGDEQLWTPPAVLSSPPAAPWHGGENCKRLVDAQPVNVIGLTEQDSGLKNSLKLKESASAATIAFACVFAALFSAAAGFVVRRTWRAREARETLSEDPLICIE